MDESRAVAKLYNDLIKRVGSKKNEIRHVAAHTDNEDARSYVNAWCDMEAKKMMWEAVGRKTNRPDYVKYKLNQMQRLSQGRVQ